jgi:AcrR family transcriptional regulator
MPQTASHPRRRRGRPRGGAREAIVAAAWDLIGEQGVAHLTTRAVARRAGVSEANLFYHVTDKLGLMHAVLLAGLEPLRTLNADLSGQEIHGSLEETMLAITAALDDFFDKVLPVLETVQADAALRDDFASELADHDLGPHRGVQLVARRLGALQRAGLAGPAAGTEAAGLLLVGACFLYCWTRRLDGPGREPKLPPTSEAASMLARLLAPAPS